MKKPFDNSPRDIDLSKISDRRMDKFFDLIYETSDFQDERTREELKSPCWLMKSTANAKYSRTRVGVACYTHRLTYKYFNSTETSIKNVFIDHRCRVVGVPVEGGGTGSCCNPNHLMAVSQSDNSKLVYSRMELDQKWLDNKFRINTISDTKTKSFNFDELPVQDLFSLEENEQPILETDLLGVVSTKTVHHTDIDSMILEPVDTDREKYKDILFNDDVKEDFVIDAGEFTDIFDQL